MKNRKRRKGFPMFPDTEKEERERKQYQEILRYAGCLENVDEDVADMCLKIMPKGKDKLISMADLTYGVQQIKDKLKEKLLKKSQEGN